MRKAPRRVHPLKYQTDFEVLYLGACGQSTRFIQSQTGLTACQIQYRLSKDGIRRADFRNGESIYSGYILKLARPWISKSLNKSLVPKYRSLKVI
jgi:hypothetical protein